MASITFYGAAGTVTGSRYLLAIKDKKFLIDCGLFQGSKENRLRNWEPFPVPPSALDAVILTHAHIDHTGYFPRLCRDGFEGPVYCTHSTAELCDILLKDTAHLQEEDAQWANKRGYTKHLPALPLFTVQDAENSMKYFKPVHYGDDIDLGDGLRLKFRDAGHILGSSMVDIKQNGKNGGKKIVFSGDLGRPARAILRDPTQIYNIDYLLLESTYGNRLHDDDSFYEDFIRIVKESIKRGGVLVIPSFAIGRTQSLLFVIRELEERGLIPVLPIYVDSPMALAATTVYERQIASMNLSTRVMTILGKKIFHPQNLHLCESRRKSKEINDQAGRAIIISASGMVTGGRILHHLEQRLPIKENTILFIGYQAEGTRGRAILEGNETVKIHGQQVPVRAHIENITGFSGHADYNETQAWLMGFNRPPKRTFIVHGEPEASQSLADKIRKRYEWDVLIPKFKETHLLDFD
nr:MBL fold metallo-hydrolase [candidate division Zixibacteria bacterium]